MANKQVQGTDDSVINKPAESNDGSLGLGFFLIFFLGVIISGVGIVNLKKEIGIFTEKCKIKSQGREALGMIIVSDRKYGYTGVKKRQYTYYLHTVRYDGFEKTFQHTRQIPVGAAVPVLYLQEEPETAIIGNPSQTFSDFKKSRFWDIFGLGFGFVIHSVLAIVGSGLVLLVIVRGIPIVLHKDTS